MPAPAEGSDDPGGAAPRPWPETACPVCGQANACVPAASGRFDLPCWCTDARFTPELIARVRASGARGCICAACAAAALRAGAASQEPA
jgi:hypothetical protein